ncbi:MAG: hypothetical protein IBX41_06920 [Methanophagales archaeon]|nr:hypothetical protein [Methanophagales archaeon]
MRVFEEEKKRALERLQRGGADEEVEELLQQINSLDEFFTTSSCSGRIALICLPEIGAKREAMVIVSKANFMLERGKGKLKRFCYRLRELE